MASSSHNVELEAAKFLHKLIQDSTDEPSKLATKLYVILQHMKSSGKEHSMPFQVISRAMETVIKRHGLDLEALKSSRLPGSQKVDSTSGQYVGSSQAVSVPKDSKAGAAQNEIPKFDPFSSSRPPVGPSIAGHEYYQGAATHRGSQSFDHGSPSSLDTRSANSQSQDKQMNQNDSKMGAAKRKRGDSSSPLEPNFDESLNAVVDPRKGKMNKAETSGPADYNMVPSSGQMEHFPSLPGNMRSMHRGRQDGQNVTENLVDSTNISNMMSRGPSSKYPEEVEVSSAQNVPRQQQGGLPAAHEIFSSRGKAGLPFDRSQLHRFSPNVSGNITAEIASQQLMHASLMPGSFGKVQGGLSAPSNYHAGELAYSGSGQFSGSENQKHGLSKSSVASPDGSSSTLSAGKVLEHDGGSSNMLGDVNKIAQAGRQNSASEMIMLRAMAPRDTGKSPVSQPAALSSMPFKEHQLKQLRAQCLVFLAFRNGLMPKKLHLEIALGNIFPREVGNTDGVRKELNDHRGKAQTSSDPGSISEVAMSFGRMNNVPPALTSIGRFPEADSLSKEAEKLKVEETNGPTSDLLAIVEEREHILATRKAEADLQSHEAVEPQAYLPTMSRQPDSATIKDGFTVHNNLDGMENGHLQVAKADLASSMMGANKQVNPEMMGWSGIGFHNEVSRASLPAAAIQHDLVLERKDTAPLFQSLEQDEDKSVSTDSLPSPKYTMLEKWIMDQQKRKFLAEQKWVAKQQETRQRIITCFTKLKGNVSSSEDISAKTKSVIELKKLQLLELQRRLRSDFLNDFFKPITNDMERLKSYKKHRHGRRIKQLEKYEQRMKEERQKRIRERQKEFFSEIEVHKERLDDVFKVRRERWKGINRYVKEFHKRKERIHREKIDRIQREKINLLKINDVEGYLRMVQDAKSDRVKQLLKETEKYLQKLGSKLRDANIKENISEQPRFLKGGKLREYQMNGLRWLVSLYNNHLNGILADEMGLGKTVQVSVVLNLLFIAFLPGWESEINFWAPEIHSIVYAGPPEERRRLFKERIAHQKFNILLTTYEYLMNKHDRPKLSKIHWHYIIIDEGHRIKNASCKLNADLKHYQSSHRLLLTGTPLQVDNLIPQHYLPPIIRLCGKLEMLDRILPKLKATDHRVLFFSTMTRLLDVMEDYLTFKQYRYLRLDGHTSGNDRGALIEKFNQQGSTFFIFLLSIRAGGVGVNLQAADTVIIFDTDWNPQVDLQAQARAHRIGQKKDVQTVEEQVRAAAEHKLGVANQSITAGFFDNNTSAEDRREYLESLLRECKKEEAAPALHDDALNDLLARSESEIDVFESVDKQRQEEETAKWKKLVFGSGMDGSKPLPPLPSRLVTDDDLKDFYEAMKLYDIQKSGAQPNVGVKRKGESLGALDTQHYGRGKRAREVRSYEEQWTEEEFEKMCQVDSPGSSGLREEAVERNLAKNALAGTVELAHQPQQQSKDVTPPSKRGRGRPRRATAEKSPNTPVFPAPYGTGKLDVGLQKAADDSSSAFPAPDSRNSTGVSLNLPPSAPSVSAIPDDSTPPGFSPPVESKGQGRRAQSGGQAPSRRGKKQEPALGPAVEALVGPVPETNDQSLIKSVIPPDSIAVATSGTVPGVSSAPMAVGTNPVPISAGMVCTTETNHPSDVGFSLNSQTLNTSSGAPIAQSTLPCPTVPVQVKGQGRKAQSGVGTPRRRGKKQAQISAAPLDASAGQDSKLNPQAQDKSTVALPNKVIVMGGNQVNDACDPTKVTQEHGLVTNAVITGQDKHSSEHDNLPQSKKPEVSQEVHNSTALILGPALGKIQKDDVHEKASMISGVSSECSSQKATSSEVCGNLGGAVAVTPGQTSVEVVKNQNSEDRVHSTFSIGKPVSLVSVATTDSLHTSTPLAGANKTIPSSSEKIAPSSEPYPTCALAASEPHSVSACPAESVQSRRPSRKATNRAEAPRRRGRKPATPDASSGQDLKVNFQPLNISKDLLVNKTTAGNNNQDSGPHELVNVTQVHASEIHSPGASVGHDLKRKVTGAIPAFSRIPTADVNDVARVMKEIFSETCSSKTKIGEPAGSEGKNTPTASKAFEEVVKNQSLDGKPAVSTPAPVKTAPACDVLKEKSKKHSETEADTKELEDNASLAIKVPVLERANSLKPECKTHSGSDNVAKSIQISNENLVTDNNVQVNSTHPHSADDVKDAAQGAPAPTGVQTGSRNGLNDIPIKTSVSDQSVVTLSDLSFDKSVVPSMVIRCSAESIVVKGPETLENSNKHQASSVVEDMTLTHEAATLDDAPVENRDVEGQSGGNEAKNPIPEPVLSSTTESADIELVPQDGGALLQSPVVQEGDVAETRHMVVDPCETELSSLKDFTVESASWDSASEVDGGKQLSVGVQTTKIDNVEVCDPEVKPSETQSSEPAKTPFEIAVPVSDSFQDKNSERSRTDADAKESAEKSPLVVMTSMTESVCPVIQCQAATGPENLSVPRQLSREISMTQSSMEVDCKDNHSAIEIDCESTIHSTKASNACNGSRVVPPTSVVMEPKVASSEDKEKPSLESSYSASLDVSSSRAHVASESSGVTAVVPLSSDHSVARSLPDQIAIPSECDMEPSAIESESSFNVESAEAALNATKLLDVTDHPEESLPITACPDKSGTVDRPVMVEKFSECELEPSSDKLGSVEAPAMVENNSELEAGTPLKSHPEPSVLDVENLQSAAMSTKPDVDDAPLVTSNISPSPVCSVMVELPAITENELGKETKPFSGSENITPSPVHLFASDSTNRELTPTDELQQSSAAERVDAKSVDVSNEVEPTAQPASSQDFAAEASNEDFAPENHGEAKVSPGIKSVGDGHVERDVDPLELEASVDEDIAAVPSSMELVPGDQSKLHVQAGVAGCEGDDGIQGRDMEVDPLETLATSSEVAAKDSPMGEHVQNDQSQELLGTEKTEADQVEASIIEPNSSEAQKSLPQSGNTDDEEQLAQRPEVDLVEACNEESNPAEGPSSAQAISDESIRPENDPGLTHASSLESEKSEVHQVETCNMESNPTGPSSSQVISNESTNPELTQNELQSEDPAEASQSPKTETVDVSDMDIHLKETKDPSPELEDDAKVSVQPNVV
ncbi:hypothetical protein GOBAR_DD21775 [Gossypium barbadense]|nr:hypothetical protein GOBAR_DD21775 [Gossypium barbadense]